MIAIGASLGGFRALATLLSGLPAGLRSPITVALHRAKDTPDLLTPLLQPRTVLTVVEVVDKAPIENATVYIAPADYHLLIDRGYLSLSVEPPVNFARPSVDVLFESAADLWRERAIAVVLTGSGDDGANGAAAIAARGGTVIVQDPSDAECPQMPAAALARTPSARILSLPQIAPQLVELIMSAHPA